MTIQRTTETFGVDVGEGSFNVTQAPGPVYVAPAAQKESWTKGLADLVFSAGERMLRGAQAEAKMQGTVDEFAGVTDAAKNANIFTRSSYEEGAAKQRVADTLANFQRESADDMAAFAANGGTPEDFILSSRKSLSARMAEAGQGMSSQDYVAAVGQADQTLNALGTAYTKYKLTYDKAQQEAVTNAELAQQNRNVLLAQSVPPVDPQTGLPDTSKHLAAYISGLQGITRTAAAHNGQAVQDALVVFAEQTARNSTVDGKSGIILMNQMYNATLQNPKLGGMSPEQQQKVLNALDGLRDRTAKEYVSDQVTQIEVLASAATDGRPIDMRAVHGTVQDAELLRRLQFITPTQHNKVVVAALQAQKAEDIRLGKLREENAGVFTPEAAHKAFTKDMEAFGATYGSSQVATMLAIDKHLNLGAVEGNAFRLGEVSKAMAGWIKSINLTTTPGEKGELQLDPVNVYAMELMRKAYATRNDPAQAYRWSTLTAKLSDDSPSLQALQDTLNNTANMTDEQRLAEFVKNRSKYAVLSQLPAASGNIHKEFQDYVLSARSFTDKLGNMGRRWPSSIWASVTGAPQSELEKEHRELSAMWMPSLQMAAVGLLESNPNAYYGEGGARVLAEHSAQVLKDRGFAVQGVAYGAVVDPGVERTLPGLRVLAGDDGQITTIGRGLVSHAVQEYRKAHKGEPEFLAVQVTAASNGVLVHGRLRGSTQNVQIGYISVADVNKYGKQRADEYTRSIEAATMERRVPIAGGKDSLSLTGENGNKWDGQAFVSAQALALGLKPPAVGTTSLLVQQTVQNLGAAPVQRALDALGTEGMSPEMRHNCVTLFAATAAASGIKTANELVDTVLAVRATPSTTDDVALEQSLRKKFPKATDEVWNKQFLPLLRAVIVNEATALP